MSKRFDDFLKIKGVIHIISWPYTQLNGIIERNMHAVETSITLMTKILKDARR